MAGQKPLYYIRGLREFQRALKKADRTLWLEVRRGLREIAKRVALDARRLASQRTQRRTGDLIRGIKWFARQDGVGVRSGAEHRGFAYPRRLEYEGRGGSRYGPRASLNPAVDMHAPDVERDAERVLDILGREWSNSL